MAYRKFIFYLHIQLTLLLVRIKLNVKLPRAEGINKSPTVESHVYYF